MTFMFRRQSNAAKVACEVPLSGGGDPLPNEIDVVADGHGFDAPFHTHGSAARMDPRLEPHMTRQEYEQLFRTISATTAEQVKPPCIVHLLWVPMIAFWLLGGFMIVLWAAKHAEYTCNGAVGQHATPFFASKPGVSYVLIPGKHGGKHGQGSARLVRISLVGAASRAAPSARFCTACGKPMASGRSAPGAGRKLPSHKGTGNTLRKLVPISSVAYRPPMIVRLEDALVLASCVEVTFKSNFVRNDNSEFSASQACRLQRGSFHLCEPLSDRQTPQNPHFFC